MPKSATSALMICSEGCFRLRSNEPAIEARQLVASNSTRSADVASNLLAVKDLKTCCILPIIAEDAPDATGNKKQDETLIPCVGGHGY